MIAPPAHGHDVAFSDERLERAPYGTQLSVGDDDPSSRSCVQAIDDGGQFVGIGHCFIRRSDGRALVLSRHTEPEDDVRLLLERLKLVLPPQPPPRISAAQATAPM